ncbi:MAG: carboxypeptidase M32 [Nitrospirota bacterium]|nr:carboxypeptidase M32 [Nitrospirota bacterium]
MATLVSLDALTSKLREIHHLRDAAAVLSWDQETYMPPRSGAIRAEQLATLQTLAHNQFVSTDIESLLTSFLDIETGIILPEQQTSLDEPTHALLRETWRDFSRAKKLPSSFVNELERECSLAQQVWAEARKTNDFQRFLPNLERLVGLKRQEADYLGYTDSPYNALLDTYEPGSTVAQLRPLFAELRTHLIRLLDQIRNSPVQPNTSLLTQSFDTTKQVDFGRLVLKHMGYDFQRGRLDLSAHPFTTSFHPTDVRVTTRVFDADLPSCLFSCIHEGGHGLYEQGLPSKYYGTPLSEAISLGIHESQSRLWENSVGRSKAFWQYFYPKLQEIFPAQLGGVQADEFYFAINRVAPSFIRVEADELTYNLHIMVRFEIELDVIEGRVQVEELPEIWNAKIQEYLGITPPNDAEGVLQDVHWSFGAFGYFPTYTLGNLYAAMLFHQAKKDIPTLEKTIGEGNFLPLKNWLNDQVHQWGRQYSASELIQRVTGQALTPEPFIQDLEEKFGNLYQFSTQPHSQNPS